MLRLTVISQTEEEMVLKVEGWVSGEDVAILEGEVTRLSQEAERLILDLEDVKFIEHEGVELLARWSGGNLMLRGGSTFLHVLLEEYGLV